MSSFTHLAQVRTRRDQFTEVESGDLLTACLAIVT